MIRWVGRLRAEQWPAGQRSMCDPCYLAVFHDQLELRFGLVAVLRRGYEKAYHSNRYGGLTRIKSGCEAP